LDPTALEEPRFRAAAKDVGLSVDNHTQSEVIENPYVHVQAAGADLILKSYGRG